MQKLKQHVLVTGGAGYIGSILVPRLLIKGYRVTVFDTFYFGSHFVRPFHKNLRAVRGDVRTPPANLCDGITAVIHLAALSNDPTAEFNPKANAEINTIGTRNIAQLAKRAGVERFILASSCSIYDRGLNTPTTIKKETDRVFPKNPYSRSKYFAEREILKLADSHFSPIILRKGTVYGYSPRMRYDLIINTMVRDALQNGQIHIFCKGKQWRPLVSVEDVVDAYLLALTRPRELLHKQIINIASDNYQVEEVAQTVQHVLQHNFHRSVQLVYEQVLRRDRSYRVSTARGHTLLHFHPNRSLSVGITELTATILKSKKLQRFTDSTYYNIEHMRPILQKMK